MDLEVKTPTNQFRVPDTERVSQVAPEAIPSKTVEARGGSAPRKKRRGEEPIPTLGALQTACRLGIRMRGVVFRDFKARMIVVIGESIEQVVY